MFSARMRVKPIAQTIKAAGTRVDIAVIGVVESKKEAMHNNMMINLLHGSWLVSYP